MTTTTAPLRTTDPEPLRALLQAQRDAWAAGDGAAFAATFTEDADFISVIGEFIRGRTELATVMQEGFDGFMKGTHMAEPDTLTIRYPAPDIAIMITVGDRPLRPGPKPDAVPQSIQTRVAVRANGTWLFTSFHNTHIREFPA
ncbi:SgcJ/EcaC family oxidoreductase [Nocardia sp. 2]|uniref:SgcJ/EcaC family oxidoreductase n=1 Tax=Nocardia acididurans TaxID=2802282 RepID=A0ABS1M9P3_9NOCA|nr:SgcJ/EcaC family oxidoreductase [Nocardia acididurans]MBL1076755.1 SgcJ/EcaC family oxidoreductase [Nocardia acididurans]